MHRIRKSVQENRLSPSTRISERSYRRFVLAGSAWVAEADGRILGFAAIDCPARTVWALFVAPNAQGAGIGRALHDFMLERARDRGLPELWLGTSAGSRAERFYRNAGWSEAGLTLDGEARFRKALR